MATDRILDYRRIAFSAYEPLCVYCGFGIKPVLEVAHLDQNRGNNRAENLVILCPTCHKMMDIDLIPTDVVIRMRDENRAANWARRMKDAGVKAVATKRGEEGALSRAASKAWATRRSRTLGRQGDETDVRQDGVDKDS